MSALKSPDFWEDKNILNEFLAGQLIKRRLAVVLGAGVSHGAELPGWEELVDRLYAEKGAVRDPDQTPEQASEAFHYKYYRNQDKEFAELVRKVLYETAKLDASFIAGNPLLNALGAIMTASSRGSAASAISFNYDDLLETHLRYRGFVVNSVHTLPAWSEEADMTVLHAHGYLPNDRSMPTSNGIVLTQRDYDRVVGNAEDQWNQRMLGILRSNTCIFIGLSGKDSRLTSLLSKVEKEHACSPESHAYWGVRAVESDSDSTNSIWTTRGVYCLPLGSYAKIPEWLFEICRLAAKKRSAY